MARVLVPLWFANPLIVVNIIVQASGANFKSGNPWNLVIVVPKWVLDALQMQ